MDDRRLAAIALRQGGVVCAGQLRSCGLSRSGVHHRCATGRLFRVRRGIYALSPVAGPWGPYWAAVLAVDPDDGVLSHWSAAVLQGFADRVVGPHHVTVPSSGSRSVSGIAIHHARNLRPGDVVVVRGLRVTSPARTILDIGGSARDDVVRRLIREAEFQGVLPAGALQSAIAGRGGHPGVRRLRRVDPRTAEDALGQTPLEDDLERLIVRTPLPPPVRQLEVVGGLGGRYRADFGWPEFRLIVEGDGRAAHVRESAFHTDRRRDSDLAAAGWLPMRFTRAQILGASADVDRQLVSAARHRGWTAADRR